MRILLAIVITLAAAWAGYWFIGSSALQSGLAAWFDARRAEGWVAEYSDLSVKGFPNRFDTTLSDLRLADPAAGLGWEAPFLQLLTLSYTPNHIIAVWPHEQRITGPGGAFTLASDDMRASVVADPNTTLALRRSTLTAEDVALTPDDGSGAISAGVLRLAVERLEDASATHQPRYHLGLLAQDVAPPAPVMALLEGDISLARVIDRIAADLTVDFDAPWDRYALEDARPQPTRIAVKSAGLHWGAMSLEASGALRVDIGGRPSGTLTVSARGWRQMLDIAAEAELLTRDLADTAERALAVMAGGNESDAALNIPLTFKGGRVWIGPIPIAPAPVLRLN
ncbi:DUF2125 domain-containing protein [Pelagivirga sediminicola]|uniref:DUF2125 domain-containing protein n=1 Tax=Pelagivirga sediminicola TaxID=2170575 RepID=A0A2T7G694_9RHOB|nr:DUF2125 domain-containing protein [Pelagivirga sediminicola]PVA09886.1 DUF2125 domain-containing protein [Pelagivirga sediminicola]